MPDRKFSNRNDFAAMSKMSQLADPARIPSNPVLVQDTLSLQPSLRQLQFGIQGVCDSGHGKFERRSAEAKEGPGGKGLILKKNLDRHHFAGSI